MTQKETRLEMEPHLNGQEQETVIQIWANEDEEEENKIEEEEEVEYDMAELIMAVRGDKLEIIQKFLEERPQEVNNPYKGCTILQMASRHGHRVIVKELLKHPDIDVNNPHQAFAPLRWAIIGGHQLVVEELLKHADIDVNNPHNGRPPLQLAAHGGHLAIVKELLKHPDIDVNNLHQGTTPLHLAVQYGHQGVVEELLKHPDIDLKKEGGMFGDTPLHIAADMDYASIVEVLLRQADVADNKGLLRAVINKKNEHDESPLDRAVSRYRKKSLQEMLKYIPALDMKEDEYKNIFQNNYVRADEHFMEKTKPVIEYHEKSRWGALTTINKMIENSPELVKIILDKSLCEVNMKDDRDTRLVVDFGSLEYFPDEKTNKPPRRVTLGNREHPKENLGPIFQHGHYLMDLTPCR